MATLDDWTADVCAALGLEPRVVDATRVLDLARDVAHGVARPAAPLTAYLLGVAVGAGQDPATAATTIRELAATWPVPADAAASDTRPSAEPAARVDQIVASEVGG